MDDALWTTRFVINARHLKGERKKLSRCFEDGFDLRDIMISVLRKSARLPLWASICLIIAVGFAASHPVRIPGFATAHREHAFDRVRSIELYLVKDEAKVILRKITGQQRFPSFHASSDVRLRPTLVSFYATRAAEKNPLVNVHTGTFHERAPPA